LSHPSKDITGSKGSELAGRKIALLVSSSVASFKTPEIARELMRHDDVARIERDRLNAGHRQP